jgi:hypothetical protein
MSQKMRWVTVAFVLGTSFCFASHCPNPRMQQAVIGGDTIDGDVRLHHKPLKFAQLRLFFSNGTTAWVGTTDNDGRFHIKDLRPDTYRLEVRGWGRTTIRISPEANKLPNGQMVFQTVHLMEDECIGVMAVTN